VHIGIAGGERRHDRGINHPQPRNAAQPKPAIHHTRRVFTHAAGANRVIDGGAILPREGEQFVIALYC
jgi:hypothetical protein